MLKDEYALAWSGEAQEFVATYVRPGQASLSFRAPTTEAALAGLHQLVVLADPQVRAEQQAHEEKLDEAVNGIKAEYGDVLRRLAE